MNLTNATWDDFWSWVFCVLLTLCLATCVGCTMGGKKSDSAMVEDMADNCKHGLKRAEVEQDDDDKTVKIECADPPRYGI
jgi:hypothetical protein